MKKFILKSLSLILTFRQYLLLQLKLEKALF